MAIFILGYYGLMRIGELTISNKNEAHTLKAKNVHMATNKDKLLLILYSSKTHGRGNIPQKIKITSNRNENQNSNHLHRHFCPFKIINEYIAKRGTFCKTEDENFFIYSDRSPVTAEATRKLLKDILKVLNLDPNLYSMHSLRIGRGSDLRKFNYPISEIKRLGRWRSNAVFRYLRD